MSGLAPEMMVSLASHGAAMLGFAGFAVVLLLGGNFRGTPLLIVAACVATAAWSGSVAFSAANGRAGSLLDLLLETLRSACWIAFLYRLLNETANPDGSVFSRRSRSLGALILLLLVAADVANNRIDNALIGSYATIGGIFAFDLFLYSEALLFRRINPDLYAVRGAIDLMAVPLMAISFARNRTFAVTVHVSRRFVFHTMTLAGTGVYLLIMAAAGYY